MGSFIQDDDYYKEMGKYLQKEAEELEDSYKSYIEYLDEILSNAIIQGDMHDKLSKFRDMAAQMNSKIANIGIVGQSACNNFSSEVAQSDTYDLTVQGGN